MGWLFAVALGLQEEDRRRVWTALAPLALGHALAVAGAVAAAVLLGRVVPLDALKWAVAATLLVFGVAHLLRHRHPARGGMQVGWRELTLWSFLVASVHGAGLMVVPFVLDATPPEPLAGLTATLLHTGAYLLVTGLVAALVYEKLGLRLLRTTWLNLDLLWAAALIATAVLTPVV